jgi:predicted AAA+ superfamily ATPase
MQDPELVKILVGVRRCGKSSLLALLREHLLGQGVPQENILEVNYEFLSNAPLKSQGAFYGHVRAWVEGKDSAYLFVDEVQELESWAQTINSVRAEFKVDIYVTGSNSRMFIGEHLTYLSGRYLRIDVYPLSLKEYADFKGIKTAFAPYAIEGLYDGYALDGSFPAVVLASDKALAQTILEGLCDSVLNRDIVQRGHIRNEAAFQKVALFVLENIGNQTSAHAIANSLKSAGHSISADTVDNYLTLMCNAHLLYRCHRYDIRGKERLKTNGKYYVVDSGLRNHVLGQRGGNRGHVTENMVFLELRRRGYDVTVGAIDRTEIDFVARRQNEQCFIQVSETVLDPTVLARELTPFARLREPYPQILITKDRGDYSTEGIRHRNLYDFLLGEDI